MLVIGRKTGETIELRNAAGEVITLMLVRTGGKHGNTARIGITAPLDWHILRSELIGVPRKESPKESFDNPEIPAVEPGAQASEQAAVDAA